MLYRTWTPGRPHAHERLLPDGSMELVFNLSEDEIRIYDSADGGGATRLPGSVVIGARTEFFVIDTAAERSVIGVHFKPGGAPPFFRLPAGELRDERVPLETLWGREATRLREQLLEAPTPEGKFLALEH